MNPAIDAIKPTNMISKPERNQFFMVNLDLDAPIINSPINVMPIAGNMPCLDSQKRNATKGMAAPRITDNAMTSDERIGFLCAIYFLP